MPSQDKNYPSGWKPEHRVSQENENAWRAVCAKLGIGDDAMNCRAGGTLNECHDKRKSVRRAVNKIILEHENREPSEEELKALNHGSALIARLDSFIDDFTRGPQASRQEDKVLRSAADIDNHFARRRRDGFNPEDAEIEIHDFLRGVANMQTTPAVRNALTVGTDTAGGFSVPTVLLPQILKALVPVSSLLQAGAGLVMLEDGAKSFNMAAVNAIPTAAWRSENGALAESDPTFRNVQVIPQSLSFMFKVSRELLADGQGLQEALYIAVAQAFAKELDRVGLRGTGTAPQPRGILNTAGIQSVTNGANGAALASYANLLSGVQSVLQADAPMPTAAIMSPRSLVKLAGLTDTTNQPLRKPAMLDGVPLIGTSQIPNNLTVGTSTDCSEIYVGDFTQLRFMLREQLSVQVLAERFADNGQVGFACHMRADVAVLYPAAFCVVTGVRP